MNQFKDFEKKSFLSTFRSPTVRLSTKMGAGSSRHSDDDVSHHHHHSTKRGKKHLRKYRNVRPTKTLTTKTSTKSRVGSESGGSTKSKSLESASKKYDRLNNNNDDVIPNKRSYSKKTSVVKRGAVVSGGSKKSRKSNLEKSDSGRGSGSCTGSISGSTSEQDEKRSRSLGSSSSSSRDRRLKSKSVKSRVSISVSSGDRVHHVCNGHCSCSSSDTESLDSCPGFIL